jgi:hypothetical protein
MSAVQAVLWHAHTRVPSVAYGFLVSAPRVSDVAQVQECLVYLPEPVRPHVVGPFGQYPLDLGVGSCDDSVRARSQPHELGAAVGGVRHALDVPGGFELFDEEAGTLLGDAGLLRQFGDAGAVRTDPGRDAGLREGDVGDVDRGQGVVGALFECSVGGEEQDTEVRVLTACGHSARLDR